MRPIAVILAVALSAPILVATAAPAPSARARAARAATPPPPSQPTIGVTAAEVEVYEDGVLQSIALFELMSTTPEPPTAAPDAQRTATAASQPKGVAPPTAAPAEPEGAPAAPDVATVFSVQGNCGVPVGAKAATLNVTAVNPTNTGVSAFLAWHEHCRPRPSCPTLS